MNQALQDIIEHRRTTNVFEPNHTISDEQIEHLVHLATRAPTSFNLQNWRFLVRLNFAHRRASDRSQLTRVRPWT
jgi:nitroreductase